MKKLFSVVLSVLTAFSAFAFTGCNKNGGGVDATKTQMYVSYFDAGFSNRWLDAVIKRFEEFYKDYSFEKGKKGVQVIPDPQANAQTADEIATKRSWLYFCEHYSALEFTTAGVAADISEAVNAPLNESYGKDADGTPLPAYENETLSLYGKMSADEKSYFAPDGEDGKIYAVPYLDTWNGTITYDADAFEKNKLYYTSENKLGGTKAAGNLGLGPDGIAGTADDGLPRTFEEFFKVCDRMQERSMPTPFVWAGNWVMYVTELATALWAANNGSARLNEILDGNGTLKDYISSDVAVKDGYAVEEKAFASLGANETYSTASVYKAVDFVKTIISGGRDGKGYMKAPDVFTSSYSQYVAQGDFVFGEEKNAAATDYGFLVDGTWWYNEAEKYIKSYEDRTGKSRNTRNLLYMPLPKANLQVWEELKGENTVYTTYDTAVVIKKGLDPMQKLLAETFLRFFCTNESLVEFNTIVSTPRGLQYTMTDKQYNTLSPYGKSTYDIHTSNADHGYSTYKVINARRAGTKYKEKSVFATQTYGSNLANTFYNNKTLTAEEYFNAIRAVH